MTIRLMVVDDEPDIEAMLRQRLRRRIRSGEIDIIFASDGYDALEKLNNAGQVDLVLTDINMPGMDGLTLLSHLSPHRFSTKTVVISAYGDMQNIRTAMNRGAFDFVTKPIEFEDLERTIDRTAEEVAVLRRAALHATEMDSARMIQSGLLPEAGGFAADPRFNLAARITQAREVGGDYYDFFMVDDDHLFLSIGDVSGKGLGSGIVMAMVKALTKAAAFRHGGDPAMILEDVNRSFCNDNPSLHFVTVTLARLDCRTGLLDVASAGHEPTVFGHCATTRTQSIEPASPPIGLLPDLHFHAAQHRMAPGDVMILATDGLSEATDDAGALYGRDRFGEVLSGLATDAHAEAVVDALFTSVDTHRGGAVQSDDLAMVVLRWDGTTG